MKRSRRTIIKQIGTGIAATGVLGMSSTLFSCNEKKKAETMSAASDVIKEPFFKISLAQWSLHKSFPRKSVPQGDLDPMDFPKIAKQQFGIDAIEFVNTFYFNKARDKAFLKDMKDRCDSEGVQPVLIMCDALGDLGDSDKAKRAIAVTNHHQWVDAAKDLGCHAIRVNAAGKGSAEEVMDAAVQGLGALNEYGKSNGIGIIVENHGGYSSDGSWLAEVMKQVNDSNCGTLPDFGNFCLERGENYSCIKEYDRYKGTTELMPYAQGVSAKANAFDAEGNETSTDFRKMMKIVKDAGYKGYVGIEYEGSELSEADGIMATKHLLEKIGREML